MSIATLLKKNSLVGLATATNATSPDSTSISIDATRATSATTTTLKETDVADVAVAELENQIPSWSVGTESLVRKWLASIGENSPNGISDVIDTCRSDPEALAWVLEKRNAFPIDD